MIKFLVVVMRSLTAWVLLAFPCAYVACAGESLSNDPGDDAGGSSARSGTGSGGNAGSGARGGSNDGGEAGGTSTPSGGADGGTGVGGVAGVARGGDGGTGNSGGAGDGGGPVAPPVGECLNPMGFSTNLELCEGGFVHRAEALACARPPRVSSGTVMEEYDPIVGNCTWDNDCADAGYCLRSERLQNYCPVVERFCHSPCVVDADCAEGNICTCKQVPRAATHEVISLGFCSPATCSIDSDCPGGALCSGSLPPRDTEANNVRLPVASFRCQSVEDECFGPGHCPGFPPNEDNENCERPSCDFDGTARSCGLTGTCSDNECLD